MAACAGCGEVLETGAAFCAKCGKNVEGATPAAPAMGKLGQKYSKQVHGSNIRSGRGAILAVSILMAIGGVVFYFILSSREIPEMEGAAVTVLVINLVLSAIFFGLWLWAKVNPFAASVTALVIYLTVQIGDAVLAPENIGKGILIKIIIVIALGKAVQSAAAYKRMQGEAR